jgi:hypothetical protein
MKKILALIVFVHLSQSILAQTGIGTTTPNASAKLDVYSTNKGFLPPRVTLTSVTDASTIPSPAVGLLVYNVGSVGLQAGYYYWNGASWSTIATAVSPDQSVDYVQASLSATQSLSSAGNIIFNTSSGAGITLSSGGFNLLANKTYKLEAALGGTSGGYAYYGWVDSANTLLSGGSIGTIMKAGSAYVDAPQDKAVVFYTPTSNTTVYLRVLTVSGGVTAYPPNPATSYSSAWANIQQVGSSAIVNPWVLSGNDVYNITGEVGIGTNAPAASALLDLSSSSKGVLIPRMTAAQKTAISSPTTGLLIFQTDASTGFYYYNGSSWISISEPNWTSAGTIQSVGWSATTTAPTIGTTAINDYSYKQIGAKTWKCQLTYSAGGSTGANIGSGDYLFTLPNGLQFNTSVAGQATYTGDVGSSSWIWPSLWLSSSSGSITNLSQGGQLYVVPYSSTQFRLIHVGIAGVGYVIPYASGYYGVGGNLGWRVLFTFQSL